LHWNIFKSVELSVEVLVPLDEPSQLHLECFVLTVGNFFQCDLIAAPNNESN
jgi:hypothetical protein